MSLAHFGGGLLVLGITVTSLLGIEQDQVLAPGGSVTVAGYTFAFQNVTDVAGPNYQAQQGTFSVTRDGAPVAVMQPEKRQYTTTATTVAAIDPGLSRDLYVALGNSLGDGQWSVRVQYKPLVRFIWLGGLCMMLGGLLAATDRRYRQPVEAPGRDVAAEPAAVVPVRARRAKRRG